MLSRWMIPLIISGGRATAAPVVARGQQRLQHCPLSACEIPPAEHVPNNELLIEETA